MHVLSIDVGGSHVKFRSSTSEEVRRFRSGPHLTAERMVAGVVARVTDWPIDAVTVGIPAPLVHGKIIREPQNLATGWIGFDFEAAFAKPTLLVNDAAMQAVADYRGARMLFLGLGTGLGSAMIADGILLPMELSHLPFKHGKTFENYLGQRGLLRYGKQKWRREVGQAVTLLSTALEAEYVILEGGNSRFVKQLPPHTSVADNGNAFIGGFLLRNDPAWREVRQSLGGSLSLR